MDSLKGLHISYTSNLLAVMKQLNDMLSGETYIFQPDMVRT